MNDLPGVHLDDYWMDRYEVTNREFAEFVKSGGYQKPEYWKNPFIKDQREISFDEAMNDFHDSTGRPGPATWEGGLSRERTGKFSCDRRELV